MPSVSTMVFITRCWQKGGAKASACLRRALIWSILSLPLLAGLPQVRAATSDLDEGAASSPPPGLPSPPAPVAPSAAPVYPAAPASALSQRPSVGALELRRQGDALELSTRLRFDLPESVRDALYKGLSVIFTAEAVIYRERWWWLDARVSRAQRQWRLVYQPLSQRWRLSLGTAPSAKAGNAALAQFFDSLDEALAVIQHVAQWRVADGSALDAGDTHRIEFHFHLDTDKLPRPLQIGALGDEDWELDLNRQRTFSLERLD